MLKGICLDGREFKLLLGPDQLDGTTPGQSADRLWEQLSQTIGGSLGPRRSGRARNTGKFALRKRRSVRYFDTTDCLLARNDLNLRERADVRRADGPDEREVTLKFRTSDLFLAAGTDLPGKNPREDEPEFEEDIGPLQLAHSGTGEGKVVAADPPSMRSRFARSTKQSAGSGKRLAKLKDAFDLFPRLKDHLGQAAGRPVDDNASLQPGPAISELVFEGAQVHLGDGVEAEFAFTLWFFDGETGPDNSGTPNVAEISFEVPLKGGSLSAEAARRASRLFLAMQHDLPVSRVETSKTALALPCHP